MSAFFADLSAKGVGESSSSLSLVVDNARLPADTLLRLEGSFRDLNCAEFEGQRSFRVERQTSSGSRKDKGCRWERMVRAAKEDTTPGPVRPRRGRADERVLCPIRTQDSPCSEGNRPQSPVIGSHHHHHHQSSKTHSKSPEPFDDSSRGKVRIAYGSSRIRSKSPRRM